MCQQRRSRPPQLTTTLSFKSLHLLRSAPVRTYFDADSRNIDTASASRSLAANDASHSMPFIRRVPNALPLVVNSSCSSMSALRVLLQARDAIAAADAAASSACSADDASQEARDCALADAEVLLSHALSVPRHSLRLNLPNLLLKPRHVTSFSHAVAVRCTGTPVPYITHSRHFFEYEFFVTADVLIPRPETEVLITEALRLAPSLPRSAPSSEHAFTLVDLGCGSGIHPHPDRNQTQFSLFCFLSFIFLSKPLTHNHSPFLSRLHCPVVAARSAHHMAWRGLRHIRRRSSHHSHQRMPSETQDDERRRTACRATAA